MDDLNFREILVRKPFWEIQPDYSSGRSYNVDTMVRNRQSVDEPEDNASYRMVTQSEFLRQYYPTGHKINDSGLFPDVMRQDPDTKKWFIQPITRCAFAFQQIIAIKQTIHLTGNDVQFELSEFSKSDEVTDDENNKLLMSFRKGWQLKDMESVFFDLVHSVKVTGDGAIVGYFNGNEFQCKTLSFLNNEKLYPHFDSITGDLELFARKYYDYDEDGKALTEWVEVWDEKYFYRARRNVSGGTFAKIKEIFGLGGYEIVTQAPHGFSFVPVCYFREENGACWSAAQDTIEKYEEAYSYFFESNKTYAFPMMYIKTEGDVNVTGDMNGAAKIINLTDTNGEVGFLQHNDVSTSYNTLLNTLYQLIYEQSFTVKPPELKSGDLPGVALKLLYSPAIEKAIDDSNKMQGFLEDLIYMFKFGYGREEGNQASLINLGINAWIEPYVHQNDTELTTNLSVAVQNKFLSKQTASERLTKYAKNDEFARIAKEAIETMKLDVEKQGLIQENSTDEEIRKTKALNQMNGSDINTGHGRGRKNKSGQNWDSNGNYPSRNGWTPGEEYKRGL